MWQTGCDVTAYCWGLSPDEEEIETGRWKCFGVYVLSSISCKAWENKNNKNYEGKWKVVYFPIAWIHSAVQQELGWFAPVMEEGIQINFQFISKSKSYFIYSPF